jgi:hypothetical protein
MRHHFASGFREVKLGPCFGLPHPSPAQSTNFDDQDVWGGDRRHGKFFSFGWG